MSADSVDGSWWQDGNSRQRLSFRAGRIRSALFDTNGRGADEPIELHLNMRCFGVRIGEGDGAVEGGARLGEPAQLPQQSPPRPVKIEIGLEPIADRVDEPHGR